MIKISMNLDSIWKKLSEGRIDEAMTEAVSSIDLEPQSSKKERTSRQTSLHGSSANTKNKLRVFADLLSQNPKNIEILYDRGLVFYQQREWQKAINDWTKIIHFNARKKTIAYQARGLARFMAKEYREAVEDLSFYLNYEPNYFQSLYYRGKAYSYLGTHNEALRDFDRCLQLLPGDLSTTLARAYARLNLKNWEDASVDFSTYIQAKPEKPWPYYWRAEAYWHCGRPQDCLADLDVIIQKDPDSNPWYYYQRARFRSYADDNSGAIADLDRFIEMNSCAKGYCTRGLIYYSAKQLDKSIQDFSEALMLDPKHLLSRYARISSFFESGDIENAERDYHYARERESENFEFSDEYGYYHRGLARMRFSCTGEARADFEKAAELLAERGDRLRHQLALERLAELTA